ncbi:ubiquinone biosynthesis monooxgenase [Umbelopsis sp. PMI_123]|nr:ubiquinone biosynthesis monooxgenase [Umbelopsis sp. PMI_123]
MATRGMKAITRLHCSKLLLFWNAAPTFRPCIPNCALHTSTRAQQAQTATADKASAAFDQSSSINHIYDVVIVGGGVAGTALACSLASKPEFHSKKIALIEAFDLAPVKKWTPTEKVYSNRVVSLTPASVSLLKDMDVWRHLRQERIKPYHDMQVWDAISGARVKFNTSMLGQNSENVPIAWMIENVHLQNGILASVEEHNSNGAKMEIIEKIKVSNISYDNNIDDSVMGYDLSDWPTVELSNGRKLKTRLLIGADGANSPVRNFANINSLGWDYDTHAVVATLEMDVHRSNDTAWQRFLPTGPIAILPLKDGISSMVWSTKPQLAAAIKALPDDSFCHLVNAALRLSPADLKYLYKELIEDTKSFGNLIKEELTWRESVSHKSKSGPEMIDNELSMPPKVLGVQNNSRAGFPLRLRNAERYIADRVALVGDAAHTIHPLAGQGLNQGLLDVQKLSEVLQMGIRNGEDIGHIHLLSHYASNRYGRNVAMLSACDKIHRLFGTEFAPVVWARTFGFNAVNVFEPVKAEIMKYAMGLEQSTNDAKKGTEHN